mmetsp:Transcript_50752/g.147302  ORF Transcript_50752/g.147302 Transcript_50752/m.147302 type:complete len:379 (-) Transcript_50752:83-1219(-)
MWPSNRKADKDLEALRHEMTSALEWMKAQCLAQKEAISLAEERLKDEAGQRREEMRQDLEDELAEQRHEMERLVKGQLSQQRQEMEQFVKEEVSRHLQRMKQSLKGSMDEQTSQRMETMEQQVKEQLNQQRQMIQKLLQERLEQQEQMIQELLQARASSSVASGHPQPANAPGRLTPGKSPMPAADRQEAPQGSPPPPPEKLRLAVPATYRSCQGTYVLQRGQTMRKQPCWKRKCKDGIEYILYMNENQHWMVSKVRDGQFAADYVRTKQPGVQLSDPAVRWEGWDRNAGMWTPEGAVFLEMEPPPPDTAPLPPPASPPPAPPGPLVPPPTPFQEGAALGAQTVPEVGPPTPEVMATPHPDDEDEEEAALIRYLSGPL